MGFQPFRLRECRKARGLTQAELAVKARMAEEQVGNLETGKTKRPHAANLRKLARALDVPVGFFDGPVEPNPAPFQKEGGAVLAGWIAESEGEFWTATSHYQDAIDALGENQVGRRQYLEHRRDLNSRLGDEVRSLHASSPSPTEIPVYNADGSPQCTLRKREAHKKGLLHHTVILLFRRWDGAVAVYKRHPYQSFAECYDFFGGHEQLGEDSAQTAIREATEELSIYAGRDRIRWALKPDRIGREHLFEHNLELYGTPGANVELTSLYRIDLPDHPYLDICAFDDDSSGSKIVRIESHQIEFEHISVLAERYKKKQNAFADGAARVLSAYNDGTITDLLNREFPLPRL